MKSKLKTGNPKIAVALVRVSTADQALGAAAQRAAITAWAEREKVTIAQWVEEIDVSGKLEIADRSGLLHAIASLELRGAGILVIHKRDRLSRSVLASCIADKMVERAGAVVVSTAGEGSGSTAEDKLMRTIIDSIAEFERAKIAMRTTAALAVKKARGERVGYIPYGKQLLDGKKLGDEPHEQKVIALVNQWYGEGLKIPVIKNQLEAAGHFSRSGKPWHFEQIKRMVAG